MKPQKPKDIEKKYKDNECSLRSLKMECKDTRIRLLAITEVKDYNILKKKTKH